MPRMLKLVLVFSFASAIPAFAAPVCSEGKTLQGKCVKPALAGAMRQRAVVTTQRKLSYTGAPVVRTRNPQYESNRDGMQQQLRLEGSGPVGSGPPLCSVMPLYPGC